MFSFLKSSEISIIHEFHKPPYGGGNQFLIALQKEILSRGISISRNRVGKNTKAILVNSYNFNFDWVRKLKKKHPHLKVVHRIDGPVSVYRSNASDKSVDQSISEINWDLADASVFQSQYSLSKNLELGLRFKPPRVIINACDPKIFFQNPKPNPPKKLTVIGTAWSDNKNKGLSAYQWLDQNLDFSRYAFKFIGRIQTQLKNIEILPPMDSHQLANELRQAHIYFAPHEHDACSNALIEALACGLPAVYRNSGGHPEIVKGAGASFDTIESIPQRLNEVAQNLEAYQQKIALSTLPQVADAYLDVLLRGV